MSLRIPANGPAQNAHRTLAATDAQVAAAFAPTGRQGGDDVSVSRVRISPAASSAVREAQTGMAVVQTADEALQRAESLLRQLREGAVVDGSGVPPERLREQLDRIPTTTTFAGRKLLDGSYAEQFRTGTGRGETVEVRLSSDFAATLAVDDAAGAEAALDAVAGWRAALGGHARSLGQAVSALAVQSENALAAQAPRSGEDALAAHLAEVTAASIAEQPAVALQAHSTSEALRRLLQA